MSRITTTFSMIVSGAICITACSTSSPINVTQTPEGPVSNTKTAPPTETPRLQPTPIPDSFGPNKEDFPPNYNPLTGQPAIDPSLLKTPALLVSISHFPATARPQAGLSFAPYVFEFYITEGATRFLTTFYGQFPAPEIPITGNCKVRMEPFKQTELLLGNRVWLDQNSDGIQDINEPGIGGMCVKLIDANDRVIDETTTDTNGYYGFNVQPGKYRIEVVAPNWLKFTGSNVGDDQADNDADQATGRIDANVIENDLSRDAGLIPIPESIPTAEAPVYLPEAKVGPVRSGRLLYAYINGFFEHGCLIYAFASEEVLVRIPQCAFVTHDIQGGGYMLDIDRMKEIAKENKRNTGTDFDYASNLYTIKPLEGGKPASQIDVYIAYLNQSGWTYDPLYEGWLRYVDDAQMDTAGILHADVDRLTGRQLHFENVIVVFAQHDVVSPTNLDIHLDKGLDGRAILFRDGQMYNIRWSTRLNDVDQKTEMRHPIRFLNENGTPAALKPGHTWVLIVTNYSEVTEEKPGEWKITFHYPAGAK